MRRASEYDGSERDGDKHDGGERNGGKRGVVTPANKKRAGVRVWWCTM